MDPEVSGTPADIPFRAIAEYTYDWESWIDSTGAPRWINAAVTRLTGRTPDECLALPDYPLCLVHQDDRDGLRSLLARALEGESHNHHEFRILHRDGSSRWGAMSFQALRGSAGEFLGYRTSVRDIQEHRRMQDELRALLERAHAADRAKTAFLASVSHELRTPLQSIIGYAELLLDETTSSRREVQARTVLEQGRHLERLVDDLLDYSALSTGHLTLRREAMSLAVLLDRVARALWPLAEHKGLALRVEPIDAPLVHGDPKRLSQVLTNLVSNAIKYTRRGEVRLHARIDEREQLVVIGVDDSGPGISNPDALFEPFRRGTEQFEEGLGLGLAIGRALCQRMGGGLTLVPSRLGGASFDATFALSYADEGSSPELPLTSPERPAATADPLTALVVDDVEAARGYLEDAIGGLGHRVVVASSAKEALLRASEATVDLVLLDLQMPEIDGWRAAKELRRVLGPGPWVAALSAGSNDHEAGELWSGGFDGALRKPIDRSGLSLLLERVAERRALRRAAGVLDEGRLADLALHRGKDGAPLLARTLERVRLEIPRTIALLVALIRDHLNAQSPDHAGVLRRTAHEVRGLAALVGADVVKQRAAALEDARPRQLVVEAAELVVALDALERRLGQPITA